MKWIGVIFDINFVKVDLCSLWVELWILGDDFYVNLNNWVGLMIL